MKGIKDSPARGTRLPCTTNKPHGVLFFFLVIFLALQLNRLKQIENDGTFLERSAVIMIASVLSCSKGSSPDVLLLHQGKKKQTQKKNLENALLSLYTSVVNISVAWFSFPFAVIL